MHQLRVRQVEPADRSDEQVLVGWRDLDRRRFEPWRPRPPPRPGAACGGAGCPPSAGVAGIQVLDDEHRDRERLGRSAPSTVLMAARPPAEAARRTMSYRRPARTAVTPSAGPVRSRRIPQLPRGSRTARSGVTVGSSHRQPRYGRISCSMGGSEVAGSVMPWDEAGRISGHGGGRPPVFAEALATGDGCDGRPVLRRHRPRRA